MTNKGALIPAIGKVKDLEELVEVLNDRFRRMSQQSSASGNAATTQRTTTGSTPSSSSTTTSAPNIASATVMLQVLARGGLPKWTVHGYIYMPGDFTALKTITVKVPGFATLQVLQAPFVTDAFNRIAWQSQEFTQDTVAQNYTAEFDCADANGTVTAHPLTVAFTVPAAQPLSPPVSISSVSLTEVGPRYAYGDGSTHTELQVTINFAATYGTQNMAVFYSSDGGSNWLWTNWYPSVGSTYNITLDKVVPLSNQTIKVYVVPGAIGGDPTHTIPTASLPSGGTFSGAYTFLGIAPPANNVVSGLAFVNYPSTSSPIVFAISNPGITVWSVYQITGPLPSATAAPTMKTLAFTVQKGHYSGGVWTPATDYEGQERQFFDTDAAGFPPGSTSFTYSFLGGLWWTYPLPSATDRTFKIRAYAVDGNGNRILELAWTGGADSGDLIPSTTPGNYLDLSQASQASTGNFLTTSQGSLGVSTTNMGTSILKEWDFEMSYVGVIGLTWETAWWNNSALSAEIKNNGGYSGNKYCRLTGPNALLFQQGISIPAGRTLSLQYAVRNNSTVGQQLTVTISFYDASGTVIATTTMDTLTANYASWTLINSATGIATAPASAATAKIQFANGAGVPGGSYWDIDSVMLAAVAQVTSNNQTNTLTPGSSGGSGTGYTAIAAASTIDSSVANYALNSFYLNHSSGAYINGFVSGNFGGSAQVIVSSPGNSGQQLAMAVDQFGPRMQVTQSGSGANGATNTRSLALAGGGSVSVKVVGGIVMTF